MRMKGLRRVATLLFAGFLAFAPPGTLVLATALALGLLGKGWLSVCILCLAVLAAAWFWFRRRVARARDARGK